MRRILVVASFLLAVAGSASAQKIVVRRKNVTLTWTASGSSNLMSYNVYRSTTGIPPFSFLANVPATETSYRDSSVASGTTYYYVITSVGSDPPYAPGYGESAYSSQTIAVIP